MANWRVNFLWSQRAQRIAGWSENFWNAGSTLSQAVENASALGNLLTAIHGRQAILDCIRVTNVLDRRQSTLLEYASGQSENLAVPSTYASDYPATAALIEVYLDGGFKTRQWLKGIYDDIVVDGGRFQNARDWQRKFDEFAAMLVNDANSWTGRIATNTTRFTITALDRATGIFTIPDNTFVTGDLVIVSGYRGKDASYLNKTWRVSNGGTNSITFTGWDPPARLGEVTWSNPQARKLTYAYPDVTQCLFKRISKRDVGRPFAVLSGRRKK